MAGQLSKRLLEALDGGGPPTKKAKGKEAGDATKVRGFVDFSLELAEKLPVCIDQDSITALLDKTSRKIEALAKFKPKHHQQPPAKSVQKHSRNLDDGASCLWNTCRRLRAEDRLRVPALLPSSAVARTTLLLSARVYAVLLLLLARVARSSGGESGGVDVGYCRQVVKAVPWLLKTTRMCLDEGEVQLADSCMTRCAKHLGRVREMRSGLSKAEAAEFDGLDAEWHVYRLELAWKQDNPDIMTHFYEKLFKMKDSVEPLIRQTMAECLFKIGKHYLEAKNFPKASQWLEHALTNITDTQDELLSRDVEELKMVIYDTLIKAKIALGTPEDVQQARELVEYLQSRLGDNPVVLYLRLSLLESASKEELDVDAFAGVLRKMARAFTFTADALEWVCAKVLALHERRPQVAASILDELIVARALRAENEEWISKTLALRVRMATAQADGEGPTALQALFDKALGNLNSRLTTKTVTAIQSLIWPKIEAECSNERFQDADKWCAVALHELFESFGPNNRAILQRKRMLCALETNNPEGAEEVFEAMAEDAKNQSTTRYLLFKAALLSGDSTLAAECLRVMVEVRPDVDHVLACVHAARQAGSRLVTLEAAQTLLRCYDHGQSDCSNIPLPTLLRCTIRLLQPLANDEAYAENPDAFAARMVDLFDDAVKKAHSDHRREHGQREFTFAELRWFSDNAYNCAVTYAQSWQPSEVARLFEAALAFLQLFPDDIGQKDADSAAVQCLRCRFGAAACLVAVARANDRVDVRAEHYQAVRHHADGFNRVFDRSEQRLDEARLEDLTAKLASLLVWDFEAAVALRRWEDLGEIVRRTRACKSAAALKEMADCVVYFREAAPQAVYSTLTTIINEVWQIDRFHLATLAKYNRFVVLAVLPHSEADAFNVVQHISKQVQDACGSGHPYPPDEVQWLVAKAFNQAVRACCHRDGGGNSGGGGYGDDARRWALVALELAQFCGDVGATEALIYERMGGLGLNLG